MQIQHRDKWKRFVEARTKKIRKEKNRNKSLKKTKIDMEVEAEIAKLI